MQYISSVQIQIPTFVSCNNCKLWFPVDSDHYCVGDMTYNYNINMNMI